MTTLIINAQIYMYINRLSKILYDTAQASCDRTLWTRGGVNLLTRLLQLIHVTGGGANSPYAVARICQSSL